jgi:hypothetical protein
MVLRVAIALIWVLSLLVGRGLWNSAATSPIASTSAKFTVQAPWAAGPPSEAPRVESGDPTERHEPRLDLFGNEVENALADYRIDMGGAVYERHSPETAVQKLGSPTS